MQLTPEEFQLAKAHYEADRRTKGRMFETEHIFVQMLWFYAAKGIVPKIEELSH
jgi:hypothetical protein